jgi:hypothetical protein
VRKLIVFTAIAAVAVAAAVFWWRPSQGDPEAGVVAVAPVEQPGAVASPVQPEPSPSVTPVRPAIETAILASIGDPGAELKGVVVRRDAPHIACGEKRTSKDRGFRRFVWLGHLKMLATDDGSAAFDAVAGVCREGQPVP